MFLFSVIFIGSLLLFETKVFIVGIENSNYRENNKRRNDMQKSILCAFCAASMLAGCAIDPYTGESKVSKTAWERESERLWERVSGLLSAVKKEL